MEIIQRKIWKGLELTLWQWKDVEGRRAYRWSIGNTEPYPAGYYAKVRAWQAFVENHK